MRLFLWFSLQFILKKPLRFLLTLLSVVMGVSLFVSISLINDATLSVFKNNLAALQGRAQITISGGSRGIDDSLQLKVEDIEGVYSVAPMIVEKGTAKVQGYPDVNLHIMAVDLLRDKNFRDYDAENEEIIDDPLEFFNQEDSIVVTREFVTKYNLKLEDPFQLMTTQGFKTFRVRGILGASGPAKAYGASMALMDINGAQYSFGKQNLLDRIDVIVEEDLNIDEMVGKIKATIGEAYLVEKSADKNVQSAKMMESFQVFLKIIGGMAWIVGLFFIFNSIYISVAQRRTEIGILRALGADKKSTLILFQLEALAVGVLGATLGIVAGSFLADFMVADVVMTLSTQLQSNIHQPEIHLNIVTIVITLVGGVVVTSLAALWPSLAATRVQPLEAFKKESPSEIEDGSTRKSAIFFLAFHILAGVLWISPWMKKVDFVPGLVFLFLALGLALGMKFLTQLFLGLISRFGFVSKSAILSLAVSNLRRGGPSLVVNLLALVFGLFFITFNETTMKSFNFAITDYMTKTTYPVIITSVGDYLQNNFLSFPDSEIDEVKAILKRELGKELELFYTGESTVIVDGIGVKVIGVPGPTDGTNIDDTFSIVRGDRENVVKKLYSEKEEKQWVLVSEGFSRKFKKYAGDEIDLDTPFGRTRVTILEQFEDMSAMNGAIFMSFKKYQELFKDRLIRFIGMGRQTDIPPEKLREILGNNLDSSKGFMIFNGHDALAELLQRVEKSFAFVKPISATGILVAFFSLLTTFIVKLLARLRELGVLRAIGMSKRQMISLVVTEGLLQGFIAGILLVTLVPLQLYVWGEYLVAMVFGWAVHASMPWMAFGFVFIISILIGVFASLWPATNVSRREIRDILSFE